MELINEIKEYLKDKSICIKDGGSWVIPFITQPKDFDLIVWCENISETRTYYLTKYKGIKGVSVFFKDSSYNEDDSIYFFYPYYWGEVTEFDTTKSDKYKQILKDRVVKFRKDSSIDSHLLKYESKFWYYLYIGKCIIDNESYELTDEQKSNVNLMHDRKEEDFETRKSLIDNLEEEIMNG